jgi:uncharacterized protein (DUF433 family)
MSQVISLRLPDQMIDRLDRFARRAGNGMTRTKASVMLLEESLRESEFAGIEYRDSPVGRQPYMKGSGLAVWEVIMIVKRYDMDYQRMTKDYPYSTESIKAAINFYEAYQEEINLAIEDNNIGYEGVKRLLPNTRLFEVPKDVTLGESNL